MVHESLLDVDHCDCHSVDPSVLDIVVEKVWGTEKQAFGRVPHLQEAYLRLFMIFCFLGRCRM